MENPNFLKQKYDLHNAPEVEAAAKRTEIRSNEKVPQNPADRIQNYLDRFKEITDREDPAKRERGVEALKRLLLGKFITRYEEIPESYWKAQEKMIRERGELGDWQNASEEDKEKVRRQTAEAMLFDQKASLEQWIDYIVSDDSDYMPDYLKYWVFRSVIGLQEYDKDERQFRKRTRGDVKQFPDLNHEALAYVIDSLTKKFHGQSPDYNYDIQPEQKQAFEQYLKQENFAKSYSWAIEQINPIPEHLLLVVEGEWKKYPRGGDYKSLARSLQGKGTGWCTAGESTARTQLDGGDFYVFYSLDEERKPTIPRLAIRRADNKIAEVRGIAYKQNLDPYMGDVLTQKLEEFPDKDEYLKKERDMARLTQIDNKSQKGEPLGREDLIFLYEIDESIVYFGYQKDPRIKEIIATRDPQADAPIVLECQPNQIAWNQADINQNTKAYIGPLFAGIFQKNIEHIYTSFPEGKIGKFNMEIGGQSKETLIAELEERAKSEGSDKIYLSDYAKDMLKKAEFFTLENKEQVAFIKIKVRDLGFPGGATTEEIHNQAAKFGLELCPPETGPQLRLHYEEIFKKEQPMGDYFRIAMKQIADRDGNPDVFEVHRLGDGEQWLYDYSAEPDYGWRGGLAFVFRLRKLETGKL